MFGWAFTGTISENRDFKKLIRFFWKIRIVRYTFYPTWKSAQLSLRKYKRKKLTSKRKGPETKHNDYNHCRQLSVSLGDEAPSQNGTHFKHCENELNGVRHALSCGVTMKINFHVVQTCFLFVVDKNPNILWKKNRFSREPFAEWNKYSALCAVRCVTHVYNFIQQFTFIHSSIASHDKCVWHTKTSYE